MIKSSCSTRWTWPRRAVSGPHCSAARSMLRTTGTWCLSKVGRRLVCNSRRTMFRPTGRTERRSSRSTGHWPAVWSGRRCGTASVSRRQSVRGVRRCRDRSRSGRRARQQRIDRRGRLWCGKPSNPICGRTAYENSRTASTSDRRLRAPYHAGLVGEHHDLDSVAQFQLGEDATDVRLYGGLG
jgi:hypothetical protein